MWDPYAEFLSTTLPNGLTIHAAQWPGRPWESLGFLVHSGAENDPVGLEGLAHFVEHLVSENAGVPKNDTLSFFADCGGNANLGSTNYAGTRYHAFVPVSEYILAKTFDIFGQMLMTAKLEKMIERERQVIIGEFYRNYPVQFSLDLSVRERRVLYAGHWLERFVRPLGLPESINRIMPQNLQAYYDAHYTPANISIVGVGGMSLDDLANLVSESPFSANKPGKRTPPDQPLSIFPPLTETRYVFEISRHVKMAELAMVGSYSSTAKLPGDASQRAIGILKDMFDEALNDEVRERRAWTYAISSSYANFRSLSEFSIDCRALVPQAMEEIESVIDASIADMGNQEGRFESAKRRALASNFMIDPTGRGVCDGALSDLTVAQRIISLAEYERDIREVTMKDILRLLDYLRPEKRWTLITKP